MMQNKYKYKDSGIDWLGKVPLTWKMIRSDSVTDYIRNQINPENIKSEFVFHFSIPAVQETGTGQYELSEDIRSAKQLIKKKSVLISKLNPRKATICIAEPKDTVTICSSEFIAMEANKCDLKYLYYLVSSEMNRQRLDARVQSVTRSHQRVYPSDIYRFWTALPSINEQLLIASYLDRETARIDALIQKKERMIGLLKEKRIALITQAVTKGLNPNVPMKESGIEWLGEIPEHWIHIVLGRVCTIQGGYAFDSNNFSDDGYPIVQMSNLKRGVLDFSEAKKYPYELCPQEVELAEGDILIGLSGSIGESGSLGNYAIVTIDDLPCYLNQRVGRLDISSKLDRGFVLYMIQSTPFFEQVQLSVTGTAQFNISPTQLGDIWIALPPLSEQKNISLYLDNETSKIDALTRRIENSIIILREYRASLIYHAVTGKIDLRDYDAQLQ